MQKKKLGVQEKLVVFAVAVVTEQSECTYLSRRSIQVK